MVIPFRGPPRVEMIAKIGLPSFEGRTEIVRVAGMDRNRNPREALKWTSLGLQALAA